MVSSAGTGQYKISYCRTTGVVRGLFCNLYGLGVFSSIVRSCSILYELRSNGFFCKSRIYHTRDEDYQHWASPRARHAGFPNSVGIVTKDTDKDAIKRELINSPNSLFIVGGAMNKEYPELMAELNDFILTEATTILVHNTTKDDFPPGCPLPPTEAIVAASAVTIAKRLLKEEGL